MKTLDFTKTLEFHPLRDLSIENAPSLYQPQSFEMERSLELSIMDRGLRQPFIATMVDDQLMVLDGKRRHPLLIKYYGVDYIIPVWVVDKILTDEEVALLQLDLGNVRKKKYVDLVNEYHLYDLKVPRQPGKKGDDGPVNRRKLIAEFMGISATHLAMLLRIDGVNPNLLKAVDDGMATLSKVDRQAKQIKKKREAEEAEKGSTDDGDLDPDVIELLNYKDKIIDTSQRLKCCLACHQEIDPEWADIPGLFDLERDETNDELDWLKTPRQ